MALTLKMYQVKEVGKDYIVLEDGVADVRVTFAGGSGSHIDDDPPITKEENAAFFRRSKPLTVGLEVPVVSSSDPHTLRIFLDHHIDLFGWLRSTPFPFPVSRVEFLQNKVA